MTYYPDMPASLEGETAAQYTGRLTGADGTGRVPYDHKRNRQCSIGYHEECSDRRELDADARSCQCPCHTAALEEHWWLVKIKTTPTGVPTDEDILNLFAFWTGDGRTEVQLQSVPFQEEPSATNRTR